jgi:hypothetical protein
VSYATLDDLRSQLGKTPITRDPAYVAKMMHALPAATSVDRAAFLLDMVRGKRVLEFGASGPMHEQIVQTAAVVFGVDREHGLNVYGFDLDDVTRPLLPLFDRPDVIVCGELIEHLSNPGWFLARLAKQYQDVPVVITVPNAFSKVARSHLATGIENVNIDHCAWYSPTTLRTLLTRAGYSIDKFHWYGGDGPTAQGLIVVAGVRTDG